MEKLTSGTLSLSISIWSLLAVGQERSVALLPVGSGREAVPPAICSPSSALGWLLWVGRCPICTVGSPSTASRLSLARTSRTSSRLSYLSLTFSAFSNLLEPSRTFSDFLELLEPSRTFSDFPEVSRTFWERSPGDPTRGTPGGPPGTPGNSTKQWIEVALS